MSKWSRHNLECLTSLHLYRQIPSSVLKRYSKTSKTRAKKAEERPMKACFLVKLLIRSVSEHTSLNLKIPPYLKTLPNPTRYVFEVFKYSLRKLLKKYFIHCETVNLTKCLCNWQDFFSISSSREARSLRNLKGCERKRNFPYPAIFYYWVILTGTIK